MTQPGAEKWPGSSGSSTENPRLEILRCISVRRYGVAASMESAAAPGEARLGTDEATLLYGIWGISRLRGHPGLATIVMINLPANGFHPISCACIAALAG